MGRDVMSLISLWRSVGNPPYWQLSACSIVKLLSQTYCAGKSDGLQPYRRQSTSQNAPLWRANPCSAIDRTVSHVQAPFSWAISIAFCSELERTGSRVVNGGLSLVFGVTNCTFCSKLFLCFSWKLPWLLSDVFEKGCYYPLGSTVLEFCMLHWISNA